MKIIVCGYMIRHPVAGNLFAYFHYLLGLYRLGHEVIYFEESGWPRSCYNPVTQEHGDNPYVGMQAVRKLIADYGMKIPICYVNRNSGNTEGANWKDIKRMLRKADLLLNIGGVCWLPDFHLCRRRVLIDMDPFFTQVGEFGYDESINEYHSYFSYGVNIGRQGCTVPTGGIDWNPTVPPVVTEIWQRSTSNRDKQTASKAPDKPYTTVANWNAYGSVIYAGEHYGQKDEEFLRLIDLPKLTSQKFEIAISGASPEIWSLLKGNGWSLREGGEMSINIPTYCSFIWNSRGEFSVAKNAYVKTRSGWFSDRSVCYLAAGRPVILQDTGFSNWLPTGRGVLAFSSIDEAVDYIDRVNSEYPSHCVAAKKIAAQAFNYKVVLPQLLDNALATGTSYQSVIKKRVKK